jgi:hypothetical protein
VIGEPAMRPEIAANASRVTATTASAQCTDETYATDAQHERAASVLRPERTESGR